MSDFESLIKQVLELPYSSLTSLLCELGDVLEERVEENFDDDDVLATSLYNAAASIQTAAWFLDKHLVETKRGADE